MTLAQPSLPELLISAPNAQCDALAAPVLRWATHRVRAFGLGGPSLRAAGLEVLADLPPSSTSGPALGLRVTALANALWKLRNAAGARRPVAALLVGAPEFHRLMIPMLKDLGTAVFWYAPPSATTPGVFGTEPPAADELLVHFPHERKEWKRRGIPARVVGHNVTTQPFLKRTLARHALGFGDGDEGIALLPSDRPSELRRLLPMQLAALRPLLGTPALRQAASQPAISGTIQARLLLPRGLDDSLRRWALNACEREGVSPFPGGIEELPAFAVALTGDGLLSLQCALAKVPPVILQAMPRRRVPWQRQTTGASPRALANLVAGEDLFFELPVDQQEPEMLTRALIATLTHHRELRKRCRELREITKLDRDPARSVAALLLARIATAEGARHGHASR